MLRVGVCSIVNVREKSSRREDSSGMYVILQMQTVIIMFVSPGIEKEDV